jgi:mannose-6-phosphate isomerase-like protein (cupin superfamily)
MKGELVLSNDVYDVIDNTELESMVISSTTLKAGKCTRGHSHNHEEVYVFLSGTGKIQVDDIHMIVMPGLVVPIHGCQFHKVYNDGIEPLVFIATFTGKRDH